jgi:type I restriction enzyme S subunit
MAAREVPFSALIAEVIDNRGRTCPTADSGVPLIATNCIRNELLYPTYEKVRFVSPETYATWFRGHPEPGDILFVNKATPGRVCLVPDPVDFCIAQDMVAVRADPKEVYPRYLFAVLRSQIAQERIAQMHVGSLIPHFKKGDFDKLLLPLPSSDEQQFIGDIYFELSAKIDLNRRMNETLEAMARALFKSWFVDFDPVRAKAEGRDPGLPKPLADLFPARLVDSELGEIPEGWEVGCVDDEFNLTMGQSPPGETYNETGEGLPFYQGRADFGARFPTRRVYCTAPTRLAKAGDTLVSVRAPVGDINMATEDCAIGRGVAAARHRNGSRSYTYQLMRSLEEVFGRFEAEGTVFGSIGKKDFHAIACARPPERLIAEFEALLAPIDSRIDVAERDSRTLVDLRDALLPKLVSGLLRVTTESDISTEKTA